MSHLVASILPKLDPSDNLLIDEIGADGVFGGVMPRGEDLLPEEQTPGGVALCGPLLLGVLLTL